MDAKIKKSVAALLAHIIKIDNRDIKKELPYFCQIMGENFECDPDEGEAMLQELIKTKYDLAPHLDVIEEALSQDKLSRYHLLEQINRMIYSDTISDQDYAFFEVLKKRLFPDT